MFKINVCVNSEMVHKNSHQTHNLCTRVKLPAKTSSRLISNISIRYILSQNYFFWTCNMLTLLRWQIPVRWHPYSLLTEKQEYARTIYTVHVHGFFAPKLDWDACCSPQIHYVERSFAFLQHLFVADPDFSALCLFMCMKSFQKLSFVQQTLLSPHFFEAEFPK